MEPRISLITLGVADVPASRAFYERLGWKASSVGGDEVAFFQAGGMALAVYGREALARDAGIAPGPNNGFPGVALAQNVHTRMAVDEVMAEAERAGAKILKPAADTSWEGYCGYFADPDGHVWEIAWNPGFPLNDRGALSLPE